MLILTLMHLCRPKTLLTLRHAKNLCRCMNLKIIKNFTTRSTLRITSFPLHCCSSFHAMEQLPTDLGAMKDKSLVAASLESHDSDEKSCDPTSMSHDELNQEGIKGGGASGITDKQEIDFTSLAAKYSSDERYGYLQKGFSTEMYKIELNNIPPKIGYKELKKYLNALKLNPAKIKKPEQMKNTCFVNFRSEQERQTALEALNGCVWKKRAITAKIAAPACDPLYKRKRKGRWPDPESEAKRARWEKMTPEERLSEAVTPLLTTPYSEQLQNKQTAISEFLQRATRDILHKEAHPGHWFTDHLKENEGVMCKLETIRGSPIQSGYRNKCEFTVGVSATEMKPVVGFRLGSYEEGDLTVVSAQSCVHVPQKMKEIAMSFEGYFGVSTLAPYEANTEHGHWRQVAIRCYSSGESMAVVQLHPQELTKEELHTEKSQLTDYFSHGEGSKNAPTSLFLQQLGRRVAGVKLSYEHLLGPEYVHEDLLGLRFRISPDAFFQVNSAATEVLYSLVKELSASDIKNPVIYDICCGTGTIGLYLTKALSARKLIGVEMVEQAVQDARVNAETNGITNTEFICGKAEDVMPDLQHPYALRGEVIGVVDPPRGGLHRSVVQAIRKCAALQRLVYVSCNPDGARKNIVDLCRRTSSRIKGLPFRPISATPVDLFPHTPHCEVVLLLERVTQGELSGKTDTAGYRVDEVVDETQDKEIVVDESRDKEIVVDESRDKEIVVDESRDKEIVVDETRDKEIVVDESRDKEIVVDETRGEEENGEKINALSTLEECVRASSEGVNSAVEDTQT